ncbi:hypothetical protein DFH09DRAFT_1328426 [Mycena vulgaris]|nr:hypothetical protein DFH09DRAFT_1328426 [Mycena vulgaris]
MDVDSDAPWGPTGLCQPGTNHSENYFWSDGSIFIRPGDSNVIYSVTGSRLSKVSSFFADLDALPTPPTVDLTPSTLPPSEEKNQEITRQVKERGGDGKSVDSPLWVQATPTEFEVFLECLFVNNAAQDILKKRPMAFWKIALKMADFFDCPTVTEVAIRWLSVHADLDPFLRLQLAIEYHLSDWVGPAFSAIVHTPLTSLTAEQITMIGFSPYIILAETQAKITKHRTLCSLTIPPVTHSNTFCSGETTQASCAKAWAHAWWGESIKHGVAVALLHPAQMPARKSSLLSRI